MVAILAIRLIRPQRISVTRMWITPILLCALTAWAIYANQLLNPAPPLEIALGLIVGALAGIPFGILRGMHTDVRPTDRRGVMYLGSSWVTLAIFAGAFASALRRPHADAAPRKPRRDDRRRAPRLRDCVHRDELRRYLSEVRGARQARVSVKKFDRSRKPGAKRARFVFCARHDI